jgi:hypothetical protein
MIAPGLRLVTAPRCGPARVVVTAEAVECELLPVLLRGPRVVGTGGAESVREMREPDGERKLEVRPTTRSTPVR